MWIVFQQLPLLISHSEVKIWVPDPDHSELPALWWDAVADKCLLLGVFKHGEKLNKEYYLWKWKFSNLFIKILQELAL